MDKGRRPDERKKLVLYRSDNHLSRSLAGLIAGAAALEDQDLAAYILSGGSWYDRKAGGYENPSYIQDVIDRAIEADDEGERGRIYEERIEHRCSWATSREERSNTGTISRRDVFSVNSFAV